VLAVLDLVSLDVLIILWKGIISAEPFKKEPGQWHQPWKKNITSP